MVPSACSCGFGNSRKLVTPVRTGGGGDAGSGWSVELPPPPQPARAAASATDRNAWSGRIMACLEAHQVDDGVLVVDVAPRPLEVERGPLLRRDLDAAPRKVERVARAERMVVAHRAHQRAGVEAVGEEAGPEHVVGREHLGDREVLERGDARRGRVAAAVLAGEVHHALRAGRRPVEVYLRRPVAPAEDVALAVAGVAADFGEEVD